MVKTPDLVAACIVFADDVGFDRPLSDLRFGTRHRTYQLAGLAGADGRQGTGIRQSPAQLQHPIPVHILVHGNDNAD